jgi:glutathione S-transferase
MKFATLDEARAARGTRLVVAAGVPSPWSEAAKGTFVVKGLEGLLVRFLATDDNLKQWTGWHNAPVLMLDDEPPRIHWTEILEAAERLGGSRKLLPGDDDLRARMLGLSHELLGENGLVWCSRLLVIHQGLVTEGKAGFPVPLAKSLGAKYGYAPERVGPARDRVRSILHRFAALADGREYLLGDTLTAVDIHLAAALAPLIPMSAEQCPGTHPRIRRAFETAEPELNASVPASLRAHRDRIYSRHLGLPVEL